MLVRGAERSIHVNVALVGDGNAGGFGGERVEVGGAADRGEQTIESNASAVIKNEFATEAVVRDDLNGAAAVQHGNAVAVESRLKHGAGALFFGGEDAAAAVHDVAAGYLDFVLLIAVSPWAACSSPWPAS